MCLVPCLQVRRRFRMLQRLQHCKGQAAEERLQRCPTVAAQLLCH